MNRGFTLIEIILGIGLVVVIGISSFFSFNSKTSEKTLSDMDNEILTALKVYIETNDEIKSKVYDDYNGVAVSLLTLQNEGLIDFGNINITDEDDYVLAFLTEDKDCSDISTLKGWDFQDGKPLYICTNDSLQKQIIDDDYIARGQSPNNWVKIVNNGTTYFWRIVEIINGDIKLLSNDILLSTSDYFEFVEGESSLDYRVNVKINHLNDYIPFNYLKEARYVVESGDATTNYQETTNMYYNTYYTSRLGIINYLGMENASATDGNWIYDLFVSKDRTLNIAHNGYGWNYKFGIIYSTGHLETNINKIDFYEFLPLITLNECVELSEDVSCSDNFENGSSNCPYILDTSKC